ncbi:MAG: DUF4102 domain-containing protein [Candidatus Melainabacteria bacterium]|nr:MAG: DUF4102 domain-containing protein [Candidatus Melainabacteria bacterium]
MPHIKLSAPELKLIPLPESGQVFYWDSSDRGFGVKATPTGLFFVVQRRLKTNDGPGKTIRKVVGRHPEMRLEKARQLKTEIYAEIGKGIDPHARETEHIHTLEEVYAAYRQSRTLRASTLKLYDGAMTRCFDDWRNLPITEISKSMIEARHKEISNRNGKRGQGKAHADQAMRFIRGLFNYASDSFPYFENRRNPVQKLRWNGDNKRESHISEVDLPVWFDAVSKLRSQMIGDYFLICILTGLRRTEAATLKWSYIDFTKRLLTIPSDKTKNGRRHCLPITPLIIEILQRRKQAIKASKLQQISNDYVFPSNGSTGHLVESKASVTKVIEISGVKFMPHDLRRTFATAAQRLKIDKVSISKLLNHVSGDVTVRYLVTDPEDLRPAMEAISDYFNHKFNSKNFAKSVEFR